MSIKTLIDGKEYLYEFASYKDNSFELVCREQESSIALSYKSPLKLDNAFDQNLFNIYFFIKKDIIENQIHQIYINKNKPDEKRIGWLIPILALQSDAHTYANDEYFLRYAYKAIKLLFSSSDMDIFCKEYVVSEQEENFSLLDIFHEYTVLLVISTETITGDLKFDISRSIPTFIRHGYVPLGKENPDLLSLTMPAPEAKRLYLNFISNEIDQYEIVNSFLNVIAFLDDQQVVLKFFLLYQIIELLIEPIYINEQKLLASKILQADKNFEQIQKLLRKGQENIAPEAKRINLLVTKYSKIDDLVSELRRVSNDLLVNLGKSESDTMAGYFYELRNIIFHKYRDFPTTHLKLLKNVVNEFLVILPPLLSNFALPIEENSESTNDTISAVS